MSVYHTMNRTIYLHDDTKYSKICFMNTLKSIGTRAAELWRSDKPGVALGALSLVGVVTVLNFGVTRGPEIVTETIPAVAAEGVHSVTGEWPGWTPDGVKPVTDMTGVEISNYIGTGAAIDTSTIDPGMLAPQITAGE
jgi:hypothetical protein